MGRFTGLKDAKARDLEKLLDWLLRGAGLRKTKAGSNLDSNIKMGNRSDFKGLSKLDPK